MRREFAFWGSVLAFIGVACGAFGAHGLESRLSPEALATWEIGARYQMYHALGLLALAALAGERAGRATRWAGWLLVAGTVVFSGSLYALALSGARMLGAITPLGGTAWLGAWLALAIAARRGELELGR